VREARAQDDGSGPAAAGDEAVAHG
jgi:hypothetical protein